MASRVTLPETMPDAKITICLDEPIGVISPMLYGHFIEHLGGCIDQGIWVGPESSIPNTAGFRDDVLTALRKLEIPVLRWPGGCYADDYHWEDGIGPRKDRPRRVNLWWGQNVENNSFGTHEFISLCRYLGAEPYFGGNVGSGTVREMRDWVEYCNFPGDSTLARRRAMNGSPMPFGVKYWGVGNENWGCGGNMQPEDYAALYRQYSTYLRDFGEGANRTNLTLIACGPDGNRPEWTRRFLRKLLGGEQFSTHCHTRLHAIAAHYYCGTAGTATEFSVEQWYELLEKAMRIEQLILDQRQVMDEFDPQRNVGLVIDEWGTWHPPSPNHHPLHLWQQSTMRDALVAAITLNIFNRHADKLMMANIAQLVNVLQSLVLTEGEKMVLTPTYHVFETFKSHMGATAVRTEVECQTIPVAVDGERREMEPVTVSASVRRGMATITITNAHATRPTTLMLDVRGGILNDQSIRTLSHTQISAHNSFNDRENVLPSNSTPLAQTESLNVQPASVTVIYAKIT
jgi:alpha-N-arabinofuranosidase